MKDAVIWILIFCAFTMFAFYQGYHAKDCHIPVTPEISYETQLERLYTECAKTGYAKLEYGKYDETRLTIECGEKK